MNVKELGVGGKTQPPVNRQRVLEELVDVYHFVMTWNFFTKVIMI